MVKENWKNVFRVFENLVDSQIGSKGRKFFPLIFTIFVFILFTNLIGMVPYSFTATSHLVVTFGLSVSLFIGITIVGFQTHGKHCPSKTA